MEKLRMEEDECQERTGVVFTASSSQAVIG